MDAPEIEGLIRQVQAQKSETQTIEFKACAGGFPKRIYDTLSSFSNQDSGGVIIFGVNDKPFWNVCGVYSVEDVQKRIMECCNQMCPQVRPLITVSEVDGKSVVAAQIPSVDPALRPVYYAGVGRIKGSFIRVADADEPMNEYEIYNYEALRKRTREDIRVVEKARVELFDKRRLDSYLERVKQDKQNLVANVPDEEILELMGITQGGTPTLAGLLSFAKYPQMYFPRLSVTAVVIPGTQMGETGEDGERFLDNKRIEGPISSMVEETTAFVRNNSRVKTIIGDDGLRHDKTEYPMKAVREAILNALVHRDYSIHTESIPVTIEMYRDRLEIRNAGGLFGNFPVESLGKGRPEARNPVLVDILEVLGVTENRYSGIPTIYKEFENYGLPRPEFISQRGEFIVRFKNERYLETHPRTKSDTEADIVAFCAKPRSREELIEFTGKSRFYTMNAWVLPLVGEGKLFMTLPDKPKSSKQRYYSGK